jgi:ribonuclease HI
LPAGVNLTKQDSPKSEEEKLSMSSTPYRALIGSLLYAARGTRPDTSFGVAALSRFNNNPGKKHWDYAKHILRYLKGTKSTGLLYKDNGTKAVKIEIFSDSDWGSNTDDRKSISGFVVVINGNPVSWTSKTQKSTALSSCEAEFMALSEAMREALWLRQLLIELSIGFVAPIKIRVDNQSAIKLAENAVQHQRSKHIDIRYFRIREEIANGNIFVVYVPTNDNIADLLTKSTTFAQFQRNIGSLVQQTRELGVKTFKT